MTLPNSWRVHRTRAIPTTTRAIFSEVFSKINWDDAFSGVRERVDFIVGEAVQRYEARDSFWGWLIDSIFFLLSLLGRLFLVVVVLRFIVLPLIPRTMEALSRWMFHRRVFANSPKF